MIFFKSLASYADVSHSLLVNVILTSLMMFSEGMKVEGFNGRYVDYSSTLLGGFWGHEAWLRNNWSRRQDVKSWFAGKGRWGTKRRWEWREKSTRFKAIKFRVTRLLTVKVSRLNYIKEVKSLLAKSSLLLGELIRQQRQMALKFIVSDSYWTLN